MSQYLLEWCGCPRVADNPACFSYLHHADNMELTPARGGQGGVHEVFDGFRTQARGLASDCPHGALAFYAGYPGYCRAVVGEGEAEGWLDVRRLLRRRGFSRLLEKLEPTR